MKIEKINPDKNKIKALLVRTAYKSDGYLVFASKDVSKETMCINVEEDKIQKWTINGQTLEEVYRRYPKSIPFYMGDEIKFTF